MYKINGSSNIFTRCLINDLIITGFQNFHLIIFTFNEHTSCTLSPVIYTYKIGYIMLLSGITLVYCALDTFYEFGNLEQALIWSAYNQTSNFTTKQ